MEEKILVLDDNIDTAELLGMVLSMEKFKVKTFTSVKEAIISFENEPYDLILSDFHMPEMSGEEFLRIVRRKNKNIPFLFITVNTMIEELLTNCRDLIDDYIYKPFINAEVTFRIKKALENSKNRLK